MPTAEFRMWEVDLVPEQRPSLSGKPDQNTDFDDIAGGDLYDDFVIIERQKQEQVQSNLKIKEEEKIKDEGRSQLLIARAGMSSEEQGYTLEDFKIRKVIDKGSFGKVFLVVN